MLDFYLKMDSLLCGLHIRWNADHGHSKMLEDNKPMNTIAKNPPADPEETI
jgi:hypothetical protein